MVILENVDVPESCFQCSMMGIKSIVHCGYIPPMTTNCGSEYKSRFCPVKDTVDDRVEALREYLSKFEDTDVVKVKYIRQLLEEKKNCNTCSYKNRCYMELSEDCIPNDYQFWNEWK